MWFYTVAVDSGTARTAESIAMRRDPQAEGVCSLIASQSRNYAWVTDATVAMSLMATLAGGVIPLHFLSAAPPQFGRQGKGHPRQGSYYC